MKSTVTIACLLTVFIAACKKNNVPRQGYTYTLVYKNVLGVPVEVRRGIVQQRAPYEQDSIVYQDTIKIAANGIYEKSQFICTSNCDQAPGYKTSLPSPLPIGKIIINGKERRDTSCIAKAYFLKQQFYKCEELQTSTPNIYNALRYKATKDAQGNTIRSEYTFNAEDLAAVK